ncbi:NmrA-like family protein [Penicillium maclennaniae]|uniref:NmrA-like family protein n=1 Tax=Penicillium maclennaniae TaxID=1343394 RepID=UPI00253F6C84|nr:NmrA-like family protein [Penicillium maclennaniae]KAJ5681389.1 NmrA-like family protein [Penicillium maclennaniae]
MTYNRIAIYGHRGWASSAIFAALVQSGAPVKVLYRPSSDVSDLPEGVKSVAVDVEDQQAVEAALQDVDIVISLVGQEGVPRQHGLVKAIPQTTVKLFVPSDLAFRCDEQGLRVPINQQKFEVEQAAKKAGIATTIILPGLFAESFLNTGMLGVDVLNNRIVFSGDSEHQIVNICTREYVAAAYAAIFATTPISELENKVFGLSEIQATGSDVANALVKRYNTAPTIFRHSLEEVARQMQDRLEKGQPLANAWYCRRIWGAGKIQELIGSDVWEIKGYKKKRLEELIINDDLVAYREGSPAFMAAVDKMFY